MRRQYMIVLCMLLGVVILTVGCNINTQPINHNNKETTAMINMSTDSFEDRISTNPIETPTDPAEAPTDPTQIPNGATETPTDPAEAPTDPTQIPNGATETPTDEDANEQDDVMHVDAPVCLVFDSPEEIDKFLAAAYGTREEFDTYSTTQPSYNMIRQKTAKDVASNITGMLFPKTENKLVVEKFAALYYVESNVMDVTYIIKGVTYRFTYRFQRIDDFIIDSKPVLTNVTMGNFTFDMYQSGGWIYGAFRDGTTLISLSVFTNQPELVNASHFDLVPRKDAPAVD